MGWLGRDKDCIALVVVWALVLQAAIMAVTSGAHAAASKTDNLVLCTLEGAVTSPSDPDEGHHRSDHPCCTMSCRLTCGGTCGGLVSLGFRVPLPASVEAPAGSPRWIAPLGRIAEASLAQPRAPPRA